MTREEAVGAIRKSGLRTHADALERALRPAIRLTPTKGIAPAGGSRFGGDPELPPDMDWPKWDGKPSERAGDVTPATHLTFLAQLNLAELGAAEIGLPASGWLCVFYDILSQPWGYDPLDRLAHRVLFVDGSSGGLSPRFAPSDDAEELHPVACTIRGRLEFMLPTAPHDVGIGDADVDAFEALRDEVNGEWGAIHHQLGGHPLAVQNPMELECQLASHGIYCGDGLEGNDPRFASLSAGASDWQLLLQLDTDEDGPRWMWGDCGRLYVWIRRQDLAEREFSRTWAVLQCY